MDKVTQSKVTGVYGFKTNTSISSVEHLLSLSDLGAPPPIPPNKIITLKIHLKQRQQYKVSK